MTDERPWRPGRADVLIALARAVLVTLVLLPVVGVVALNAQPMQPMLALVPEWVRIAGGLFAGVGVVTVVHRVWSVRAGRRHARSDRRERHTVQVAATWLGGLLGAYVAAAAGAPARVVVPVTLGAALLASAGAGACVLGRRGVPGALRGAWFFMVGLGNAIVLTGAALLALALLMLNRLSRPGAAPGLAPALEVIVLLAAVGGTFLGGAVEPDDEGGAL